ncbi:MAG: hypothetical protein KAR11_05255 [Phycisphaerae bacterium]|nr:hypothetical protein [Phycisphaerae bacterium]
MKNKAIKVCILFVLAAMLLPLPGCRKKVTVVFTNLTHQQLEVYLTGSGKGVGLIGAMGGHGETAQTKIVLNKSELPAPFTWNAGPYSNAFVIDKDTKSLMSISVGTEEDKRRAASNAGSK